MNKWSTFAALAIIGAGATSFALSGSTAPVASPSSLAATQRVILGHKVAPLTLLDTSGRPVTLGDWNKSKATVVMFVATQCPVSNAYNERMTQLRKTYAPRGVRFVGINSNKAESGAEVAAHAAQHGFGFAVYKDPRNKTADRFEAKVTPEAYIISAKGELLYHGRIDNSMNLSEVNENSLQLALDAVLAGKPVAQSETRPFGCSIKREN